MRLSLPEVARWFSRELGSRQLVGGKLEVKLIMIAVKLAQDGRHRFAKMAARWPDIRSADEIIIMAASTVTLVDRSGSRPAHEWPDPFRFRWLREISADQDEGSSRKSDNEEESAVAGSLALRPASQPGRPH